MCGVEAVKLYVSSYRSAFPSTRFTILSIASDGNLVSVCWASRGTHACARAGKNVVTGLSVYRVAAGKIVEGWVDTGDNRASGRLGATREQE